QSVGILNTSMLGVTAWTSTADCTPPIVSVTWFACVTSRFCCATAGFSGEHGSDGSPCGLPPSVPVGVHAIPSTALNVPPVPPTLSLYTRTNSPARGRTGTTRTSDGAGPPRGPVGVPTEAAVLRGRMSFARTLAALQVGSGPQCSHWLPSADTAPAV